MVKKTGINYPYSPDVEKNMIKFYNSLNEKDRRHYAALEAQKLRYGGVTYIAELFNCARPTIDAGTKEFKKK